MKGKPVLVKSKKDNCSGKRKFKSLFVEFEKGHANTNVILQRAFTDGDMFADQTPVRKYHKGRPVDAWELPPKFISELYRNKTDWKLKFKVYVEFNGFFQLFTLLDPATRQKAKKARIFKILANEKARLKSTLKTPFKNAENAVECIKKHFGDDYRIEEFELKAGEKYPENYEQCRSDIWIIIHPQKKRRCLIIRNNQNESISFPNKAIVVCIRTGSYYCLNAETKVSCTLVSKM